MKFRANFTDYLRKRKRRGSREGSISDDSRTREDSEICVGWLWRLLRALNLHFEKSLSRETAEAKRRGTSTNFSTTPTTRRLNPWENPCVNPPSALLPLRRRTLIPERRRTAKLTDCVYRTQWTWRAGFDSDYPFPTSRIHNINGEIVTHGERTIIKRWRRLCGWESISARSSGFLNSKVIEIFLQIHIYTLVEEMKMRKCLVLSNNSNG